MKPKISIITPTFNRGFFLEKMIQSVLAQSFKSWELLIMDDGSKDNSRAIVKSFKDPRIRYYYSKHSGAGARRNEGIQLSNADFITFLDSDDEALPNWLDEMNKELLNNHHFIACGYEKISGDKSVKFVLPQTMGTDEIRISFKSGTLLFNKKILMAIDGFDSNLAAGLNTDLILKSLPYLHRHKLSYTYIDKPLLRINEHTKERIRNNNLAVLSGTKTILEKHTQWFKKNPDKHSDYLGVVGVCYAKEGEYLKARKRFEKAIKFKPNIITGLRVILTYLPVLRNIIWKKNENC